MFQFLSCTRESRAGPSTLGLQSRLKGRTTSLSLLAELLLMQPRRLLTFAARAYCWLMLRLSTTTPRTFSVQLLFRLLVPSLYCCMELWQPRCRTLHLSLLSFTNFLPSHSPSHSLWTVALASSLLTTAPNLVLTANLLQIHNYSYVGRDKDRPRIRPRLSLQCRHNHFQMYLFYATVENFLSSHLYSLLAHSIGGKSLFFCCQINLHQLFLFSLVFM